MFETHGWGKVTSELHALLERGDTDAMASLITDEIPHLQRVGHLGQPGRRAGGRYGGLVDRVAPYGTDLRSPEARQRWRQVTADLRARI